MNLNPMAVAAILLTVPLFWVGMTLQRKTQSRLLGFLFVLVGIVIAVPGFLLVVYYTHLFDSARWFCAFRTSRFSEISQPTAGFRPRCVGAAVGSRIFYVQGRNGDLVSRSGFSAAKFQNELCHSVSRSYFPPSPFIAGVVLRGG